MKNNFLIMTSLALCLSSGFLSGCHSSSSDDNKAPETGRGVPADQINYRLDLVSLITGSYTGDCVKFPEGTVTTDAVVITPVGEASTTGASGTLLGSKVNTTFTRKFVNGTVDSAAFSATDVNSDKGLMLAIESGTTPDSNLASARQGIGNSPGIKCTKVANAADIKSKSALSVIGKYLTSAKRTVSCLMTGNVKTMDYTVTADTATLGDETFSFVSNVSEETANILPTENLLTYSVKTTDDRSLAITLDGKGKLKILNVKNKDGTEFGCVP